MKKKLFVTICAIATAVSMNVVSVFAARPGFAFNVYAYDSSSVWTDNMYGNVNAKTIDNDDWTLILDTLSFSKPVVGVGMAYAMFKNNTRSSSIVWRTGTGTGHYSWDGKRENSYNLKGRLDTDQPGKCVSNGVYNADTIY